MVIKFYLHEQKRGGIALSEQWIQGAEIIDSKIDLLIFSQCTLVDCIFDGVSGRNVRLIDCTMYNCFLASFNFEESYLEDVTLDECVILDTKLNAFMRNCRMMQPREVGFDLWKKKQKIKRKISSSKGIVRATDISL